MLFMLKKVPHWDSSVLDWRVSPCLHPAAVDVGVHALVGLKHFPAAVPQRHRRSQGVGEVSCVSF